jgi:integrase
MATFRGDVIALRAFYRWASLHLGVYDPVAADDDYDLLPHGVRAGDIKWLDPAGYRRWCDLGLLGRDLSGRADPSWRGRNDQRNTAFSDGLYGTGLRLVEAASVILPELPADDPARGYSRCRLADACAKGGRGHPYWMPRWALLGILSYCEGARAAAVRHAQRSGLYDGLPQLRVVTGQRKDSLQILEPHGLEHEVPLNALGVTARRRLFRRTRRGLEPLAVWLNEDGMPRDPHGWHRTFSDANERIAGLGLNGFTSAPHVLRHSFALRWYAVGKLVYEKRFGHLSEEESRDFRAQFGDTWHLVATLLGHANPQTAKKHYLEPFATMDVELLLRHANEASIGTFLSSYLADHPCVQGDPLAVTG